MCADLAVPYHTIYHHMIGLPLFPIVSSRSVTSWFLHHSACYYPGAERIMVNGNICSIQVFPQRGSHHWAWHLPTPETANVFSLLQHDSTVTADPSLTLMLPTLNAVTAAGRAGLPANVLQLLRSIPMQPHQILKRSGAYDFFSKACNSHPTGHCFCCFQPAEPMIARSDFRDRCARVEGSLYDRRCYACVPT